MVRSPCFDSNGMKKGAWSEDEDNKLRAFILSHGHWNWRLLPKYAGLKRCGKSCRLRWVNHLKPGVKRGNFSKEEEHLIIKLHTKIGNKWSAIAAELPGRTDNDIKNFWNTRVARHKKPYSSATEASSTSSSMDDHQLFEMAPNHHESSLAFNTNSSATNSQLDLWGDKFPADANCCPNYADFPPLMLEEEFCYPQFYYNDWIADEDHSIMFNAVGGSIWDWDESFALTASDSQPQSRVCAPLDYDPFFSLWNS